MASAEKGLLTKYPRISMYQFPPKNQAFLVHAYGNYHALYSLYLFYAKSPKINTSYGVTKSKRERTKEKNA